MFSLLCNNDMVGDPRAARHHDKTEECVSFHERRYCYNYVASVRKTNKWIAFKSTSVIRTIRLSVFNHYPGHLSCSLILDHSPYEMELVRFAS